MDFCFNRRLAINKHHSIDLSRSHPGCISRALRRATDLGVLYPGTIGIGTQFDQPFRCLFIGGPMGSAHDIRRHRVSDD